MHLDGGILHPSPPPEPYYTPPSDPLLYPGVADALNYSIVKGEELCSPNNEFRIIERVSPYGHIEIMNDKDGSKFTVNRQRLKHYLGGIINKEEIVHDLT
ncbi:hypothetical protein PIB30_078979 [Stylosanthes scabra]|uniref:Uncharacterized protein n=1 Tax=Stylosanthes scabra TaxID=79078 RepID=A0ABU6XQS5_9FABA|nr:hypothetical protein [Stylosanthes scabra]